MPIGKERVNKWFGPAGVGGGPNAGNAGLLGGAMGVSPQKLDDEDGVCANESGCGCGTTAAPRVIACGGPMRPASKVDFRSGVWAVLELNPIELSSDMRVRVLDAAGPGIANSPS